ncbi:unnamed protein product [Didymodactylos carnosus]|uniref:Uncharacterized protein n=1 Tax=Didymodactylos carnosus TaxID=1234261 RepID=A0A815IAC6_9BILA|nr:unnamed protein product [Didymodactylos carnosus]CAF1362392.1 unnamed protein product [Didymodactylos carnosus]CAF3696298.1 unnamed protein product [Didymodactylos carnosus]CAF4242154.1 unnamed protein product [Didymodactylos carnosus]
MNRGGVPRGPRKGGRRNRGNTVIEAPRESILKQPATNSKPDFSIAPLVLEGITATKVQLNKLILTQLPDAKLADIQLNRNTATSTDCPKLKEQQQKIKATIDQYSTSSPRSTNTKAPRMKQETLLQSKSTRDKCSPK